MFFYPCARNLKHLDYRMLCLAWGKVACDERLEGEKRLRADVAVLLPGRWWMCGHPRGKEQGLFGLVRRRDEVAEAKRLVLAFDAGCMTCSDLARRIEERVGGKLRTRSLWDPQVQEWRKRTLGDEAPWAPTLIQVGGGKVKAWTGWKMGINLSRLLGPVSTWRVMRTLGEAGELPKLVASPGSNAVAVDFTRGQFLKGVGGGALAMSLLSGGGALFPSVAQAQTFDPARIRQIVENSEQYNSLTLQVGKPFDLDHALYVPDVLNNRRPTMGIWTQAASDTGAAATFFVDLQNETVAHYRHKANEKDDQQRQVVTAYEDGNSVGQIIFGKDYIILPDGRRIGNSQNQLAAETDQMKEETSSSTTTADECDSCRSYYQGLCDYASVAECAVAGAVNLFLGAGCSALAVYSNQQGAGCVGYGASTCIEECM